MAFTVEGYYEQENNQGVVDRIEIQQDGGDTSNIEFNASSEGFRYRLSEITRDSDDGLINPLANQIQIGKLTFFPRIETTAQADLIDDIINAPNATYRLVWKRDSVVFWTGIIDTRKNSFPETGGDYIAELRASDFDLLKNIDYTLDDTRQTLITTIADLLGNLSFGYKIRTATSWITEDTTDTTDFLSQIYHETKALRRFGGEGEDDRTISVFEALERIAAPALLIRQMNGEFTVEQLSEFDDPQNVNETLYTSAGAVDTATATVDRRQTGHTQASSGTPSVKVTSQNEIYPGVKRTRSLFDHRAKIAGIQFPPLIVIDDGSNYPLSQFFLSDGTQFFRFSRYAKGKVTGGTTEGGQVRWRFRITKSSGDFYDWDQANSQWGSLNSSIQNVQTLHTEETEDGDDFFGWTIGVTTTPAPADADGTVELTLGQGEETDGTDFDEIRYTAGSPFEIVNSVVGPEDSTSIEYLLTQANGYSEDFDVGQTWFGDGPVSYALSALRFSSADADVTDGSWQRRGTTTGYRKFHENLLKEILDLQRGNVRKLQAELWGGYDPTKILVYDSANFYPAGISYRGVYGRWSVAFYKVSLNTGSDTFEEFFLTSSPSSGGTSSGGGSGGGVDPDDFDSVYLKLDASNDPITGDLTVNGAATFDIGTDEFRIKDGSAMFVVDGSTGQIALGTEPVDDVGLLLDTPARAVTDNTDYDRLKVTNSGQLTIAASTTSPIVATAQFDEPNINLASGAAVTNAATVYIESAPTEGDDNWALYAPSGASLLESLNINGTEVIDSSRNASFVGGTFTGDVDISSTSVLHQLEIDTPTSDTNTNTNINFLRDSVTQAFIGVDRDSAGGLLSALTAGNDFVIRSQNNGVAIATNGNNLNSYFHPGGGMSIGTLSFSGSEKLRVAGDIRADESIIADSTSATWPRFDLSDNGTVKFSLRYELTGNKFALLSFDDGSGSLGNIIEIPYPGNDVHFLGDLQTDNFSAGSTGWQISYAGALDARSADIDAITTRTLRTTLFKPQNVVGMAGEVLFSAVTTVVSIDTGANEITVEDAIYNVNDAVVVSSGSWTQLGFSNVFLTISSDEGASGSNHVYGYTVDSGGGSETDIEQGDTVSRVSGDLLYINATDTGTSPSIAGYDNIADYGDSPFGGSPDTAVWELSPSGLAFNGAASSAGSEPQAITWNGTDTRIVGHDPGAGTILYIGATDRVELVSGTDMQLTSGDLTVSGDITTSTFTSTGLADIERLQQRGNYTFTESINDDIVSSRVVTNLRAGTVFMCTMVANDGTVANRLVEKENGDSLRLSTNLSPSSPWDESFQAGSGAPSNGSGTDGNVTLYINDTGDIYVSNRYGQTITFTMTIVSGWEL